jgi:hypothetical protein
MLIHTRAAPRRARRGSVTPFVAVCLIVLIGFLAIAVDGGLLLGNRRSAQSVADAAARAAASDLAANWSANKGLDPNGTAKASALSVAAANGYSNDGTTSLITPNTVDANGKPLHGIWMPPISGDHVGVDGYVEVIVQYQQSRGFSRVYGSGNLTVTGRTVARGFGNNGLGNIGILVLNKTASKALSLSGSATINVNGKVIVDSSDTKAASASGGASLVSTEMDVTGNIDTSGSATFKASPLTTGATATADPLSSLAVPDPSTLTTQSTSTYKTTTGETLQPGVYKGGINISSNPGVTLSPGIYYIEGGGITVSGSTSTVTANGVMIYNGPDSSGNVGAITFSGGSTLTMSPITSGTYQGMAIFQARTSTQKVTLSGGSGWNMTGSVYAAGADVDLSGGSNAKMGSQYICDTMSLSGNSAMQAIDPTVLYKKDIRIVE